MVAEPTLSTIKTLFAYSSNICARPRCEERLTDPAWPRVKGQLAHIRGEKPGSARYDPTMTDAERAAYENLILLCPNCHKLVDDLEPDAHTVEVLEVWKDRHEEDRKWASPGRLREVALLLLQDLGVVFVQERQILSPVVRRLLAENNIDPDDVQGTGVDGRITREDMIRHLDKAKIRGRNPNDD